MSTVAPASIVQPPRATGRPTQQQTEECRAIGRLVHVVEGHSFSAGAELVYARDSVARYPEHDAGEDAAVDAVEVLGYLLQARDLTRGDVHWIGRAIVAACQQYRYHDGHCDTAVNQTGYRVSLAHVEVKAINGACELAVAGVQRGRPAARTTGATQMSMEMGESDA